MSERAKYSTFQQRIDWLLSHPGLSKWEAIKGMKRDGLIAPTTYIRDCRFTKEFQAVANIESENKRRDLIRRDG